MRVCALPADYFLSAKKSFRRLGWSAATKHQNGVTAHANWIDGHDAKREAFETHGAWITNGTLLPLLTTVAPKKRIPPGHPQAKGAITRRHAQNAHRESRYSSQMAS